MKDKNIAGILALFFGLFGVHRFYLGQTGLGILYLVFFWTGITTLIGLIDAIVFLSMDRDEFDMKYNRQRVFPDHRRYDTDFSRTERRQYRAEQRELRQQRRVQRRQQDTQRTPQYRPPVRNSNPARRNNPFKASGIQKYKDFDYEGAIEDFKKGLSVEPQDIAIHFNLACAYSLMEERENSFFHLSKAVEFGFVDFKKIMEHDALAYLRIQDEFDIFKKNGYRLNVAPPPPIPAPVDTESKEESNTAEPEGDLLNKNDILLDQIKRLGELREKGLLTEEEFEIQKRKLLG